MRTSAMWCPAEMEMLTEHLASETLHLFENAVGAQMSSHREFKLHAQKFWRLELGRRYGFESLKPFPTPEPAQA